MRRLILFLIIVFALIIALGRSGIFDGAGQPAHSLSTPSPPAPAASPISSTPTTTLCQPASPPAGLEGPSRTAPSVDIESLPSVKVTRVIDGDTIVIEGGRRVRYIGINTPETHGKAQPFGQEATEANRALVEGKMVRLEKDVSETDKYGRLLRYVYVDGTFVNAELVRQGYAQAVSYPPDVKYQDCFRALEREAREARRGLWGR